MSQPSPELPRAEIPKLALAALYLSVLIVTIDISMTSTALPAIARALGVEAAHSIWVVNGFYLAVVASLLPAAALGEIYGHRLIFLCGLGIFGLGVLACGLSDTLATLTASRALAGVGSAAVSATTPALVRAIYPPDRLGRGLGHYALAVGITISIGPTLASTILSVAAWRWVYLINVPFALLALLIAWRQIPGTDRNPRHFDIVAACMSSLLLGCGLFSIVGLSQRVPGFWVVTAFVVAAASGYLLAVRERGVVAPILALDLFKIPVFALSSVTSILAFTVQGLIFVVLPFLLQARYGFSQVEVGFMITPWPVTLAIMTMIAAPAADRVPPGLLGGIGLAIVAFGLTLLSALPSTAGVFDIAWRLVICGIGYGFFQSPNMKAIMSSAPRERSGAAGGILSASRLVGQSTGAAAVAICLSMFPDRGMEMAIWVGIGVAIVGSVVSFLRLLPGVRLD